MQHRGGSKCLRTQGYFSIYYPPYIEVLLVRTTYLMDYNYIQRHCPISFTLLQNVQIYIYFTLFILFPSQIQPYENYYVPVFRIGFQYDNMYFPWFSIFCIVIISATLLSVISSVAPGSPGLQFQTYTQHYAYHHYYLHLGIVQYTNFSVQTIIFNNNFIKMAVRVIQYKS